MSIEIKNFSQDGLTGEKTAVNEECFSRPLNETLVHQLVTHYLSWSRAGTSAQKTRSEVQGGGKKPWRQKGTGRARAGTTRSPIFRSGGVTFASKTRSYKTKLNKKMYRAGIQCIFSELIRQDRMVLGTGLFDGKEESLKTRQLADSLKHLSARKTVIMMDSLSDAYQRATGNIPNLDIFDVNSINPASLVGADVVIVNQAALKTLEDRFV